MAGGQQWLPFDQPKTDRLLEPIAHWSNLLRAWEAVGRALEHIAAGNTWVVQEGRWQPD